MFGTQWCPLLIDAAGQIERVLDGDLGDWIPGTWDFKVLTANKKALDQNLERAKACACSERHGWGYRGPCCAPLPILTGCICSAFYLSQRGSVSEMQQLFE